MISISLRLIRTIFYAFLLSLLSLMFAHAANNNLVPKYGNVPKSDDEKVADSRFIEDMDKQFDGDRPKAAQAVAQRGWEIFRTGDADTAIKRFNQAWLLDPKNVLALWGMATVSAARNDLKTAVPLFLEAQSFKAKAFRGEDINLNVDCAKAMSMLAVQSGDASMMKEAMARFDQLAVSAPRHPMNWQNWAVALYFDGDYAAAWEKVAKMEALGLPQKADPNFIDALSQKMPRPATQ